MPNHTNTALEAARTHYLADLQRVHLLFDEQMSDVQILLHSLIDDAAVPFGASSLDTTRAIYLQQVRAHHRTLDAQVLELAKACTHLFAPALGLSTVA